MQLDQDQYVTVDGLKIRYRQQGEAGPYLLLVHGIGACLSYFYANMDALAKEYRVIALDLPGFGKSDKPDIQYSLEFYARFLKHFVDALHIDQLSIIGHSLGGAAVLGFALDNVKQVKKIVLVDNVGFGLQVIIFFRLMRLPIIGKWLTNLNRDMFIKALRTNVYDPFVITDKFVDMVYPVARHPDTQRAMLNIIKHNTNLCGMLKSSMQPLWSRYELLKGTPILIFWGKQDRLLKCDAHVPAARRFLPHARVELIENCGHIAQMEHPQQFNQTTLDFLRG